MSTPLCCSPCATAMLVAAAIGRYTPSTPAFLMPSTCGPTSWAPKSTEVLVYVESSPTSGTAYFMKAFAVATDDDADP